MILTQERLKQLLDYDPETGIFIWKWNDLRPNNINARFTGKQAGCVLKSATGTYWTINISGYSFLAHRLAWLYVHGYMPEYMDHKDRNGLNNCLNNLRSATKAQNEANKILISHGIEKHGRKYRARIWVDKVKIELGSFDDAEAAIAAYYIARVKYYGEYARVQ